MKKIFIIFSTLLLSTSCVHTIKPSGIVTAVEKSKNKDYSYTITVSKVDYCSVTYDIKIYTNTLYKVGDTIEIMKYEQNCNRH